MRFHVSSGVVAAALACLFAAGCAVPTEGGDATGESGKGEAVAESHQALFGQTPTLSATQPLLGGAKIDGAGFSANSPVQVWMQDPNTHSSSLQTTVQTTAFVAPTHCTPNHCEAFTGGTFEVTALPCVQNGGTLVYWGFDVASSTWSAPIFLPVGACVYRRL